MKITSIEISVFELPISPATTHLIESAPAPDLRWKPEFLGGAPVPVQVIRVSTDEGIDGVCTVGDWR